MGFGMLLELLGWLSGGAEGNRTPDLCSAIAALSHLSYSPAPSNGRLPSRLFPPLQSLVPGGFRPADLGRRKAKFNRNGARPPFVSPHDQGWHSTGPFHAFEEDDHGI